MKTYQTLTVYLGSSGHCRPIFKKTAHDLGELIAKNNKNLVYGGMDAGLMGELALTALKSGSNVTGIVPRKLKDSERVLGNLTQTIMVEDLWERKKLMFGRADAIIALPGGFGTLDETSEALFWANLGLHNTPVVFVDIDGYYDPLIQYLETLPDYREEFVLTVKNAEDIFPALENAAPLFAPKEKKEHFPHFEDEILNAAQTPIVFDKPNIANTYFLLTMLGLKQLNKTERAVGLHNKDGQFDHLLKWFEKAAQERFITPHCLKLFEVDKNREILDKKLAAHKHIVIDLDHEKWGPSVEKTP